MKNKATITQKKGRRDDSTSVPSTAKDGALASDMKTINISEEPLITSCLVPMTPHVDHAVTSSSS